MAVPLNFQFSFPAFKARSLAVVLFSMKEIIFQYEVGELFAFLNKPGALSVHVFMFAPNVSKTPLESL